VSGLVLSLFPGIGLLDRAFEEAGFCVVRGPDVIWGGDVRRFIPPRERFDGVIGGPPCQSFSALTNLQYAQGRTASFGNLIPEFERIVSQASPTWFLMENVTQAPKPIVRGFVVDHVIINNRWLGEKQNRVRRFSFGTRDGRKLSIATATQQHPEWCCAVTSAHGGTRRTHFKASTGGKIQRYTLADACELQGLPRDHFANLPFRADAALKAVANGVPLSMGRAVVAAIKRALSAKAAA